MEVEAKILRRYAGSVSAYNIVPLAGVVGEFDGWKRRLEWYWTVVCFIQPAEGRASSKDGTICSGAALIDKLRQEAQTGYPDIEEAALELGKVAETAWLRQLAGWVLYGRLPLVGGQDFFVQRAEAGEGGETEYQVIGSLLPRFVSRDTASSMLFIGKSLNTIWVRGRLQERGAKPATELDLVPAHLEHLKKLVFPLSSSSLASTISAIRLSLSRNTLQQLLPLPSILQILSVLRDFFLLKRGEFAVALINEADTCLRTRNKNAKITDSLKGMLIKEAELTTILTKTFAILSNSIEEDSDATLEFARSLLHLQTARLTTTQRPATPGRAKAVENLPQLAPVAFNDLLLPMSTNLAMDITPPFDLFLTPAELTIYSSLQSYILSIRRAHLRLCSLWRQTSTRRTFPTAPMGNKPHMARQLASKRERAARRHAEMRAMWATCSAAVFLLGEMGNYFEGEVIGEAWERLLWWVTQEPVSRPGSARSRPASSRGENLAGGLRDLSINQDAERPAPHDPAHLTTAHRAFLTSLAHALLLTDTSFTTSLRQLLTHIDSLVALVTRLTSIRESLDLEEDEGVLDPMGDFARQEKEVLAELGRARKRVDAGLRGVVERLRGIDGEGVGGEDVEEGAAGEEGGFVPHRGGGIERLLLRIEGRRGNAGDDQDDDEHHGS